MWAVFSMDYYAIGQRIKKIRKAQSLSQEQLAEKIGISTTHMSHIETGNTKLSLQVLVDIATNLEVGTDELLFETPANQKDIAKNDIQDILNACTPQQAKVIAEIIKSTKIAMDKYI